MGGRGASSGAPRDSESVGSADRRIYDKLTGQTYAVSEDGNVNLEQSVRHKTASGQWGDMQTSQSGSFTAPDNDTDGVVVFGMPSGAKEFLAMDATKNTILTDGRVALNRDSANNNASKHVADIVENEMYALIGVRRDGTFYRVMNTAEGVNHLKSGNIRPSVNHMTGKSEGGLSVWEIPKYGGGRIAVVTGKVNGIGSDGEPVLDVKSVRFVKVYENDTAMRNKAINAFATRYHWTEKQVRDALTRNVKIRR